MSPSSYLPPSRVQCPPAMVGTSKDFDFSALDCDPMLHVQPLGHRIRIEKRVPRREDESALVGHLGDSPPSPELRGLSYRVLFTISGDTAPPLIAYGACALCDRFLRCPSNNIDPDQKPMCSRGFGVGVIVITCREQANTLICQPGFFTSRQWEPDLPVLPPVWGSPTVVHHGPNVQKT